MARFYMTDKSHNGMVEHEELDLSDSEIQALKNRSAKAVAMDSKPASNHRWAKQAADRQTQATDRQAQMMDSVNQQYAYMNTDSWAKAQAARDLVHAEFLNRK